MDLRKLYGLLYALMAVLVLIVGALAAWTLVTQQTLSLQFVLLLAALALLLGAVSALGVLRRRVTAPLLRICDEVAGAAQRQQFGTPITIEPHGELNRLTLAINRLMHAFEEQRRQLGHVHEELERRVEARTHELTTANAELSKEIAERREVQDRAHRLTSFYQALSVGSSRVDLQACKLEYSIVSPK